MDILDEIKNAEDIIDWLLNNNFNSLNFDNKCYIIKALGRPKPNLKSIKSSDIRQNRGFSVNWYTKCDWLTASVKKEKLFCWPCCLFSLQSESATWSKIGYCDLKNLPRSAERHSKSKEHIFSSCKLKLFGKQNMVTEVNTAQKKRIISYNNQIRENRSNLKQLIDATMYLASQELAFSIHDEVDDYINRDNYKELLLLWGKYDSRLDIFLNGTIFSGTTAQTVQNELIESISYVIQDSIRTDIQDISFFAWEIDEIRDISCGSQLSIIFRYVNDGKVIERFMGFHDVSSCRTTDDLFNFLLNKCDKFNFRQKLIAQTYDGTAAVASHINGLQTKIKSIAPRALFTHCHAHELNLVLIKECNNIKDCRIFFSNLSGFVAFFSKSTERSYILNEICGNRMPTFAATCWNSTSTAVFSVHSNKDKLIDVFDYILNSDDFKHDDKTIREAQGLKYILKDHKFCFLLEIFKLIFEHTDGVFSIFQNNSISISYSKQRLNNLTDILTHIQNNDNFLNNIFELINLEPPLKKIKTDLNLPDLRENYKQIYIEILDTINMQIKVIFADLSKLGFFDLLLFKKFSSYLKDFPEEMYNDLLSQYPFDAIQLKNELVVMYSDPQMFGSCKTPFELLNFMFRNNLHECMPELFRFISIVLTIPITPSVENKYSALKRIKTYSRNTMSNIALLSIEKEYIKKLVINPKFYEDVIDHFANSKNRNLPLIFKSEV
ncbi:zinc finger MYM-type protein 1-like [Anthonomus grandis grandis]|uniref:zinc finger MYM-type protein 1-like n=1 Tax=Anthonomus grandis grandis TaxID=2921223 RepID=UPI002165BE5F|nr:zinc finger MYM-type protein 1-like [Anthonomus grandis grandis]XP_050296774.1 zinc finger MYM-type protein 1-like [Anthonomus grandis grandis]XP_050296775.1 zinc finger MYM-type protein 1-like [Anthonomus grandis grandis]XP_050296776.1 zinc finger MYM-type protein 1-like [Anthonomus grandis grandis]XP_050296777.1 zinc finger MYM-type protein 1-like [Anthonomus grandis grandis]XP_050296778.1 zinc finger MYM-type protein 1-like [Anthonomus grandis grandis]XP_050296779.1 zinc finger MYM-type